MTRPVLARTSSAASGLRFCGMIEEPEVNLSLSRTSPTSGEVQITISSAKRDMCTAAIEAADRVSSTKSRSETASSELAIGRKRGSGQRRSAQRRFVQPLARIGKTAAVARGHLDIGQQMMAERHRLRGLQMGKARHHGRGMFQRAGSQGVLEGGQRRIRLVNGVADIEPEIGRDLVVAGA